MTTGGLQVTMREHDATPVVGMCRELDRAAGAPLAQVYELVTSGGARSVVLDFEHTAHINSSAIAAIVGLLAHARAEGVLVSASGLSDHYREIFEIGRLADFLTIADGRGSADEGSGCVRGIPG